MTDYSNLPPEGMQARLVDGRSAPAGQPLAASRPKVTTLCGSTRFPDAFALANMHLSLRGRIVIGLGMLGHADEPRGARFLTSDGDETQPEKRALDELHFRKIDLSDGIFVVNVGGYVGSSTKREIAYARSTRKTVEWMFPDAKPLVVTNGSDPASHHPVAKPSSSEAPDLMAALQVSLGIGLSSSAGEVQHNKVDGPSANGSVV